MVSDQMGKTAIYEALDFENILLRGACQVSSMNGSQRMNARSSVPWAGRRWLAGSWVSGTRKSEFLGNRLKRYVM